MNKAETLVSMLDFDLLLICRLIQFWDKILRKNSKLPTVDIRIQRSEL